MKKIAIIMIFVFYTLSVFAAPNTQQEIAKAGQTWAIDLSSGNPEKIASLYDKNALLYATFNNKLDSHQGIIKYFKNLMQKKDLRVRFTEQHIRVYHDAAINSGFYVFSFQENGKTIAVPARYTFVYSLEPSGWKIIDHHSSVMPEK